MVEDLPLDVLAEQGFGVKLFDGLYLRRIKGSGQLNTGRGRE